MQVLLEEKIEGFRPYILKVEVENEQEEKALMELASMNFSVPEFVSKRLGADDSHSFRVILSKMLTGIGLCINTARKERE